MMAKNSGGGGPVSVLEDLEFRKGAARHRMDHPYVRTYVRYTSTTLVQIERLGKRRTIGLASLTSKTTPV